MYAPADVEIDQTRRHLKSELRDPRLQ
jgi:hypothetical protein